MIKAKIAHIQTQLLNSPNPALRSQQQLAPQIREDFEWYSPTYMPNDDDYFGKPFHGNNHLFHTLFIEHHVLSACLGILPPTLTNLLYPHPHVLRLPPQQTIS